jgi:hypothetical protein
MQPFPRSAQRTTARPARTERTRGFACRARRAEGPERLAIVHVRVVSLAAHLEAIRLRGEVVANQVIADELVAIVALVGAPGRRRWARLP